MEKFLFTCRAFNRRVIFEGQKVADMDEAERREAKRGYVYKCVK